MTERTVIQDDVLVTLAHSERRTPLYQALYYRALSRVYPELAAPDLGPLLSAADGMTDAPDARAAALLEALSPDRQVTLFRLPTVRDFVLVAAHVRSATGLPFEWPDATAEPTAIDQAYRYLLDHDELFDVLVEAANALALPNGKAGASPEQLNQADREALENREHPLAWRAATGVGT